MLLTLTLNMLSHPFSGKSLKGPPQVKPALFTRTWILSSRFRNSAMRASQPAFDYINKYMCVIRCMESVRQLSRVQRDTYPDVGDDVVGLGTTCNLVDVSDGLERRRSNEINI